MEVFRDRSNAGNEKAYRKGVMVPEGDVNLAYFKAPDLTPEQNIVVVDTSRVVEENNENGPLRKLYYANTVGVLEDEDGNQLIVDEYPAVTDEFLAPEDYRQFPASQYTTDDILPYIHVSRYFHLDFSGQTLGNDFLTFSSPSVKVIRADGREHVDDLGAPRYKVKIIQAFFTRPAETYEQAPYRLHVFVDIDTDEDLYLTYNKIEINSSGILVNQDVSHREILNPKPYFQYQPEESAVVDPENRHQKWYSSKPINLKDQILNLPKPNVDGYKVYVPKKAVTDPRIFQLFRWRVSCDFTQRFEVDPSEPRTIRAGVAVTSAVTPLTADPNQSHLRAPNTRSLSPYALYNLAISTYNATGVSIQNPLGDQQGLDRQTANYWYVSFDTITFADLQQFDFLIWSPPTPDFDFTPYLAKIDYFVNTLGRTLFIDTNSETYAAGIAGLSEVETYGVAPWNGVKKSSGGISPTLGTDIHAVRIQFNTAHPLIDGLSQLGGWEVEGNNTQPAGNEVNTLTFSENVYPSPHTSYFGSTATPPAGWNSVVQEKVSSTGVRHYVLERSTSSSGHLIVSSFGILFTCSALIDFKTKTIVDPNQGQHISLADNYFLYINSSLVEGAMKFLYNAVLLSVKSKVIHTDTPTEYSSSWTFSTPWQSSWVIDAGDDVLSQEEIQKYQFAFLPKDIATPTSVWQRKLSDTRLKDLMDDTLTDEMKRLVSGAARTYRIEVTNSKVEVPLALGDNSFAYAWTEEYSPKFIVPIDLGAYIIKEEEIKGQYEAGQFIYRSYPAKPYGAQVRASYIDTESVFLPESVNWVASGTALETFFITEQVPPSTRTVTSEVQLTWVHDGNNSYSIGLENPYKGVTQPNGMLMDQQTEYHASLWGGVQNNWMHYGLFGQWSIGSSGEAVAFVQWALNRIQFWKPNLLNGPGLAIDGQYGGATAAKVRQLQISLNARYIDSVVDAETLSLIGGQLVGLGNTVLNGVNLGLAGTSDGDYTRWARAAIITRGQLQFMSDGNPYTVFSKRSWVRRGPNFIWEVFAVAFRQVYQIHGVTIVPFLEGATKTMLLRGIDVRAGYPGPIDPSFMTFPNLPYRMVDGQPFFVPFNPIPGAAYAVCVGQDGPAVEASRMIGIRDMFAHAQVQTTVTTPGFTRIIKQTRNISISDHGSVNIGGSQDHSFFAHPSSYKGTGTLSNIVWTSVATDSPNVSARIRADGLVTLREDSVNLAIQSGDPTRYNFGPLIPGGATYFSMDENRVLNPVPEQGFITKIEGIKLLCNADRSPYGFKTANGQSIIPTIVGSNDFQRHYVKLSLVTYGLDTTVRMGFYDIARQEFVFDSTGESSMSFIEYMTRGPSNIYIGIVSTYELDTQTPLPLQDDAPKLPYRMAMPVYGIATKAQPRITLEPVPGNLGVGDIWPVAVKDGKFDRTVQVRTSLQGPLTGYLSKYQGKTVHAFYGIAEVASGGWSRLFGPPNADVHNEEPLILDDSIIQIRQPPIHLQREPTIYDTLADPVRPQFTVYRRPNQDASWTRVPLTRINDWNSSTGEIFLADPLAEGELVKVDYTSVRRNFYFKGFGEELLNLNPYPGVSRSFIGVALHIYILPEYVKDETNNVISESIQTRTIRFTTETKLFDPLDPEYNPLAIQLGVVYISPGLDVNDLVLLDTRRRGGGALNTIDSAAVIRIVQEASTYWDIGYGTGLSYQKGGFVIIRLPAELKNAIGESDIISIIDRNITSGVRYKIEDLNGAPWS